MKDYRTFLRLQKCHGFKPRNATGRKKRESRISNAGLAKQLESKVYILAMIQPVPKSKKERKNISRLVNLAI
jgi:hypothetical protein